MYHYHFFTLPQVVVGSVVADLQWSEQSNGLGATDMRVGAGGACHRYDGRVQEETILGGGSDNNGIPEVKASEDNVQVI